MKSQQNLGLLAVVGVGGFLFWQWSKTKAEAPPAPIIKPVVPVPLVAKTRFEVLVSQGKVPPGFTGAESQMADIIDAGYPIGSPIYDAAVDLVAAKVEAETGPNQVVSWTREQGYHNIDIGGAEWNAAVAEEAAFNAQYGY